MRDCKKVVVGWLGGLGDRQMVENIVGLLGVQVLGYLVPLATIPYLARILGPHEWGAVLLTQAYASWVGLVIEFGFTLSATRRIAEGPSERVGPTVHGVLGAQSFLGALCVAASAGAMEVIPVFRSRPELLVSAVILGIAQGFSPMWYFLGIQRAGVAARRQLIGTAAYGVGIFLLIRGPHDGLKVVWWQCVTISGVMLVNYGDVYRTVRLRLPTLRESTERLVEGGGMFLFRAAASLYSTANAVILGMLASPVAVGYYGGADRIARALQGLAGPVSQVVFPKVSANIRSDYASARRLAVSSVLLQGGGGLVAAAGLIVFAPVLVRAVLGSQYAGAVGTLRLLGLLVPLIGTSNVLGIQWMLPLRMDKAFNVLVCLGAVVNCGAAVWLAPRYGAPGMAVAVVGAETLVTVGMAVTLQMSRSGFWNGGTGPLVRSAGYVRR